MVEETNRSNDLTLLKDSDLPTLRFFAGTEVGRIADDLLGLYNFLSRADTDELAILVSDNLIDGLVEHVGTAVDGRETGEGLRELSKTVERINVGRFAVAGHGGCVQNNTVVGRPGRFGNIATRRVRRGSRDELWRAYSSSR